MTNPTIDPISYKAGIEAAKKAVAKRRDDYIAEHGNYDPSTGVTEFPGNGDEYVGELDEIEELIGSLHRTEPQTVCKEFTNELGNRIKITIEGPTSISETILTPLEFRELQAAITLRTPVGKLYAETVHVRCHSAASPCNHQKSFPGTVCQVCYDATTADAERLALAEKWPEPKVTNPDIPCPTGIPYIDCLIHRLLDAQQDINYEANTHMSQSLCDAAALIDEVETVIRRLSSLRAGGWRGATCKELLQVPDSSAPHTDKEG